MHDFVAHSIVYAAVEVCHYIVAEFHSFLDASRTAVVRLLRTALINCQLLTIYSLRYPILTLRRTSTTKPCTLLILCFIIQGTSPKEQLQQPNSKSQIHRWIGPIHSIFLYIEMRSGILYIDARSISRFAQGISRFFRVIPHRMNCKEIAPLP